jgi:hypothetical protein
MMASLDKKSARHGGGPETVSKHRVQPNSLFVPCQQQPAILILDFAMEKFPNFARKQGQF